MAKNILNIAVIGCSPAMGQIHMDGIKDVEGINIYAVCDTARDNRLMECKEKYGAERAVKDYKELLDDEKLDAVIIVTPDQVHREMACAFLRAGKDVLCEKPMALTLEECEDMMRAEKESGRKLMIGQICRFTDNFKKAKELIDDGRIGELYFVESEYAHHYGHARGYDDWRVTPERDGFIGGGCHAVDLLRWIAGDPITVYGLANHKCLTDWPTNDCTVALYQFPISETERASKLKSFGVITSYICPLMYMNNPLCAKMPVITSSNKLRTYTTARYHTDEEILEIITKGGKA